MAQQHLFYSNQEKFDGVLHPCRKQERKPTAKAVAIEYRARSALILNSGLVTFSNISIG